MIRCRTMRRAELDTVLDWAAEEGWNPGLDDAEAFWAADPEGFFVAEANDAPVAAISVVRHGPDCAFLGLYLCRPSHRGRGVGLALWRHALVHAGDRVVGLDGVPEQQGNYVRSGFRARGATVRHVGRLSPSRTDGIRDARIEDVDALIALEATASGAAKPAYMAAWFGGAATRRTLVQARDATPVGAVTVRRCRDGAKIGPLIAPDPASALALARAAAACFAVPVSIDVPGRAGSFGATLRAEGLLPTFRTARMYRGEATEPSAAPPRLFAVASLELG